VNVAEQQYAQSSPDPESFASQGRNGL
jgi:hypothetical protein